MTTQLKKYYIIGGVIALLSFLGYKAIAAKKNTITKRKVKKGTIVIGELSGEFTLPDKVTTQAGTRLRKSSSTKSSIIYTYQSPKEIIVSGDSVESDGQWFKVIDGNKDGWVRSDVVDYKKSNTNANDISNYDLFNYFTDMDELQQYEFQSGED